MDEPFFCAPDLGPDIYYTHQMFWCDDYPRLAMVCGEGARCVDTDEGQKCRTYVRSGVGLANGGLSYELMLPQDMVGFVAVAALYGSYEIARRTISSLSLGEMLEQDGLIEARLAPFYAEATGLRREAIAILDGIVVEERSRSISEVPETPSHSWGMQCSVP